MARHAEAGTRGRGPVRGVSQHVVVKPFRWVYGGVSSDALLRVTSGVYARKEGPTFSTTAEIVLLVNGKPDPRPVQFGQLPEVRQHCPELEELLAVHGLRCRRDDPAHDALVRRYGFRLVRPAPASPPPP